MLLPLATIAQNIPLVENTFHGLTGTFAGSIAHGDVNNDGNEDILSAGFTFSNVPGAPTVYTSHTELMLGDGNGGFTATGTPFPNLGSSFVALLDLNGDGNLDAYMSGLKDNGELFAAIYLGDGNGGFGAGPHQVLTGLQFTGASFGDLDGDGDNDMIATGMDANNNARTIVYRNDNGVFTEMATLLQPVMNAAVAILDVDNDGANDVILIGNNGTQSTSKMYKNNGNFAFSELPNTFPLLDNASISVADINGDGFKDLALMGTAATNNILGSYLNNQDGTFSQFEYFGPGASIGEVIFGDMNNDGVIDGFFVGEEDGVPRARMYVNDGTGHMTQSRAFNPGYRYAATILVDINNDGQLDIIFNGTNTKTNCSGKIKVWWSHIPMECINPSDLVVSNIDETSADVSWTAGGEEVQWEISYGLAGFDPITAGNVMNSTATSATLSNLLPGTGYDVYVRSVCEFGEHSSWAGPVNFVTDIIVDVCEAPTNISVSNITPQTADVFWDAGGNELQWEVSFDLEGFDPNTSSNTISTGINMVTLTDLLPGVNYEVYVRSVCNADEMSDWTGPISFTTGTISVGDFEFLDFSFYPNPIIDFLYFQSNLKIENVQIFNILGQSVLIYGPVGSEVKVNCANLTSSVYLLQVTIDGKQKVFRVIKE